jgi:hypothetical protein
MSLPFSPIYENVSSVGLPWGINALRNTVPSVKGTIFGTIVNPYLVPFGCLHFTARNANVK